MIESVNQIIKITLNVGPYCLKINLKYPFQNKEKTR